MIVATGPGLESLCIGVHGQRHFLKIDEPRHQRKYRLEDGFLCTERDPGPLVECDGVHNRPPLKLPGRHDQFADFCDVCGAGLDIDSDKLHCIAARQHDNADSVTVRYAADNSRGP